MATFSNIDGEESATVTFTVGAVQLTRNSSAELQEIIVLGDPENAASIARISSVAPKSTDAAIAVRIAGGASTITDAAFRVLLPSTFTDNPVRALLPSTAADNLVRPIAPSTYGDGGLYRIAQSSAADLNVTVAGYVAPTTQVVVSSISTGHVTVDTGSIRVHQSTYTDLQGLVGLRDRDQSTATAAIVSVEQPASTAYGLVVRLPAPVMDSTNHAINVNVVAGAAGGSTIMTVSTGSVRVHQSSAADLNAKTTPLSTLWASSAGFHFDSSGALYIQPANAGGVDYTHGSTFTASTVAGPVGMLTANIVPTTVSTGQITVPWGTPQGAQYVAIVTDSGATVMDSTNQAIKVNVVAGAAGGSTIVTVSTGSVRVHQSTAADLNVTVAGYVAPSTVQTVSTGSVRVHQSTATDLLARVNQGIGNSSAADEWLVKCSSLSTGHVTVDTGSIRVHQSTATDLLGRMNQGVGNSSAADEWLVKCSSLSTGHVTVDTGVIRGQVYTSSGGAVEGSTLTPPSDVMALHVRQVPSSIQSTIITAQSSNSTVLITLLSSVASKKHKVFAYFVGASTSGNHSTVVFLSSGTGGDAGAAKNRWAVIQSSGVFGANLAVNPPAFLFATDAGEALTCRIESLSTRIIATIALSYVND